YRSRAAADEADDGNKDRGGAAPDPLDGGRLLDPRPEPRSYEWPKPDDVIHVDTQKARTHRLHRPPHARRPHPSLSRPRPSSGRISYYNLRRPHAGCGALMPMKKLERAARTNVIRNDS